jgi:RimJ/RimL family protein N-acetyltransferase
MPSQYLFNPILEGQSIRLVALETTHRDGLKKASLDESVWTFNRPLSLSLDHYTSQYIEKMRQDHQVGDPFSYVVFSKTDNHIIGSTRYYGISKQDKRLCIGFTWYSPNYWGSAVNPESKLLLLSQAFETLDINRVEFHVDSRNTRSISAMLYLGASLECIMKKHKIVQGDFVRDTVLFSILKNDWLAIKSNLKLRLKRP